MTRADRSDAGDVAAQDPGRGEALRCFERGDFARAASLLVSLLARSRPEPMLLRLCGMALTRSGATGKGLPYLARARRMTPQDPIAALWHGIALHAAERYEEAVAALRECGALAPTDPSSRIHLARALLKLDRPNDALRAARQATALQPGLPEAQHALHLAELAILKRAAAGGPARADAGRLSDAWLALGLVCMRLGKVQDARQAMGEALAAQPQHAEAAAQLALVEHLCGEPVRAVTRLRATLRQDPGCQRARLFLAGRLLLEGECAEALALLDAIPSGSALEADRRALRVDALMQLGRRDAARAALALTQADRASGDAAVMLHRQQLLLAQQDGDPGTVAALAETLAGVAANRDAAGLEARIDTHFALGDLDHARGRRPAAFAHWQQGHRLLQEAQPFSRRSHEALTDTIIRVFDRARLAGGPRAASRDPAPVFIGGLPRTGTTLTEHILSAHAAVHGGGERLAVREVLARLTGTGDAEQALTRAAALDAPALSEAAGAFAAELHALAPAASLVLDKLPDNFALLGFIAILLPGARVIACTRDLRDVGASIFRRRFLGHHPYAHELGDLGWYMAQHVRLLRHWQATLPLPMLLVDLADWIDDFDATLRRVLGFLGLPEDPACARFFEQERVVKTASRDQVRRAINAGGVGRWRQYAAELRPMIDELPRMA